MTGNLENIGFAKEGKAGLYNILIMEENRRSLHFAQARHANMCQIMDRR